MANRLRPTQKRAPDGQLLDYDPDLHPNLAVGTIIGLRRLTRWQRLLRRLHLY